MRTENAVFLLVLLLAAGFFSYNVQRLLSYLSIAQPGRPQRSSARASQERHHRRLSAEEDSARSGGRPDARAHLLGLRRAHRGDDRAAAERKLPGVLVRVSPDAALQLLFDITRRLRRARARRDRLRVLSAPRAPSRTPRRRQSRAQRRAAHPRRHRRADGDDVRGQRARARARAGLDHARQAALARALDSAAQPAHRSAHRRARGVLVDARAARARVSELPAVLEASAHRLVDSQRLPLQLAGARPEGRDPLPRSRGGERRAVRRGRRRPDDVEGSARRLHLHRVRPLHLGMPRASHGEGAEPAQDHHRHAPPAHGEGAAHARRLLRGRAPRARARRGRRREHERDGDSRASAARQLHHRGRALAVHDVPRVHPGMPGVGIEHLDHIVDMRRNLVLMESRFPARGAADLRVDGAKRIAVGVPPGRSREVGRGARHPDDGGAHRTRREPGDSLLGGVHGLLRRSLEEDQRRLRAHSPGSRRALRDSRAGRDVQRRSRAPHGQRVSLPDARRSKISRRSRATM